MRQVLPAWNLHTPKLPRVQSINAAKRVVVVVPTLNEENGIGQVLDRINKVLEAYEHHVVIVDGHSSDSTVKIAKEKGASIIFQPNKGYGDALRAGFKHACNLGAHVIVMVDGDGTYDPHDFPAVINPILSNESDVVIGSRFELMDDGSMPFINIVGNRILSLTAKLMLGVDVSDTQCGLRAMHVDLVRGTNIEADGMPFATEMLVKFKKSGARISEVPVFYHVRKGNTKMKRFRDGFAILRIILANA